MATHVRMIARCMLCVDRGPTAKDIKMMNIEIKQDRITNIEIRFQADCAIDSCGHYSRLECSPVMSI